MIQVFFNQRGSGKSKNLVNLANEEVKRCKGSLVYIDKSRKRMFHLDSQIRLVCLEDLNLRGHDQFYGMLQGLIASDYDLETIFIDGLCNILNTGNLDQVKAYFTGLEEFSKTHSVNVYINLHSSDEEIPEFIKKYVA